MGVDPEGSYFPRAVQERPTGSPLEADFAAGRTPQRFDATALPAGATLRDVVYTCHGVTLTVNSPQPFTARYLSFDFPGWAARVDGARVPIAAEDPTGLITFAVPAGEHQVEVRWGATPLRLGLVSLSVLSLLGVVVVAGGGWPMVGSRWRVARGESGQQPTPTLNRRELIGLASALEAAIALPDTPGSVSARLRRFCGIYRAVAQQLEQLGVAPANSGSARSASSRLS